MLHNLLESLEPHLYSIYILHITFSLILAIFLSVFVMKRFVLDTEEVQKKDKKRLEEISQESWIFRQLFKVSLHKNNRLTNIFFMFLFNLSMPIVGYPFAIWITYYLRNVKYEKKGVYTDMLNLDEFGVSFLQVKRIFGEGSMGNLMLNEYAPKSKKLKALSALANHLSPENIRIIRQALSSTDDETRMFGYAIINKAEKSLNTKINYYLKIYREESDKKENQDKEKMADAAKELAMLYWEMIYTELAHESLKENFMQEVRKYLLVAKGFYIDEFQNLVEKKYKEIATRLYILTGKVYMSEEKYELAKEQFTLAQELHEEQLSFVLPYLAEIYYITGKYKVVSSILDNAKDLELNATLHPIIEQWKVS